MIGQSILHYKILSKLGEGGMGVVYKARDTKLDREVALKLLPRDSNNSREQKNRFEREAKAAAKLNHPNIATIHAIEEVDGRTFIAMEYVDGESLAERIKHGPLQLKEAIEITHQISEGLQAAHERGIIHRDIKSQNVMLTPGSKVKIMDFGLAKETGRTMLTKEGTTLGTVDYMSPEQAQGIHVDHRTDIWSVGVILYEMISGSLPFKGEYEPAIVYSILNEAPEPLTSVRSGVSLDLERVVDKLLEKDPQDRYQNIQELPVDLRGFESSEASASSLTAKSGTKRRFQSKSKASRYSARPIVAILSTAVLTFALTWLLKPEDKVSIQNRLNHIPFLIPDDLRLYQGGFNDIAISPDGMDLAYVVGQGAHSRLMLKRGDSFKTTEIGGTTGARAPFFSPDGRWIGFFDQSTFAIRKVLIDGGNPVRITSYKSTSSATWTQDNSIIFSDGTSLVQVTDSGEIPIKITNPQKNDERHFYPRMLPNGKTVLFTIVVGDGDDRIIRMATYTLEDDEYRIILNEEGFNAAYVTSGHVLFGRSSQLMAVPFDLATLVVAGDPVMVINNVATEPNLAMSYSISTSGTIAYAEGADRNEKTLMTVSLTGQETLLLESPKDYHLARYSPDGKYAALEVGEQNDYNIWIYSLENSIRNQLTFYEGHAIWSFAWSPDSRTLAFSTSDDSCRCIYLKDIDGIGGVKNIFKSSVDSRIHVQDWSSDGNSILFSQINGENKLDLFFFSFLDSTAKMFYSSPANEFTPQFSPDGNWVLYMSSETGVPEVYVRSANKEGNDVWKISDGWGDKPLWAPDGNAIYYHGMQDEMILVPVSVGTTLKKGKSRVLFSGDYFVPTSGRVFDIHPDGDRFLMISTPVNQKNREIRVIQNFSDWLNRISPPRQ